MKKLVLALLIAVLTLGLAGTALADQGGDFERDLDKFERVWMYPNPLHPMDDLWMEASEGKRVSLRTTSFCFTAKKAGNVLIKIYNYKGLVKAMPVKPIKQNGKLYKRWLAPGRYYEGWNGKDNNGRYLPAGTYKYVIELKDGSNTFTYTGTVTIHGTGDDEKPDKPKKDDEGEAEDEGKKDEKYYNDKPWAYVFKGKVRSVEDSTFSIDMERGNHPADGFAEENAPTKVVSFAKETCERATLDGDGKYDWEERYRVWCTRIHKHGMRGDTAEMAVGDHVTVIAFKDPENELLFAKKVVIYQRGVTILGLVAGTTDTSLTLQLPGTTLTTTVVVKPETPVCKDDDPTTVGSLEPGDLVWVRVGLNSNQALYIKAKSP